VGFELPEMVTLPGGWFEMGNDVGRPDERPAHRVLLESFRVAVSPITNAQYARYVHATGASTPPFIGEARFASPELPVVGISWFEAVAYCEWLSRELGARFRLSTEAEREYAARGGLAGADWPWQGANATFVAWVNSLDGPHAPTDACANGFGLRCMAENVHEWCSDWYDAGYYAVSPAEDPRGPEAGVRRAARGGSWRHKEKTTRVSARSSIVPTFQYSDFGFRVYADDYAPGRRSDSLPW
jgi:formylglycine-generating enzyme required for sulfatase activity